MSAFRTLRYVVRLAAQSFTATRPTRRLGTLVLIALSPVLIVLGLIVGLVAPFVIYPFV
ncbi:MAG: hypothetical protein ACKOYM_07990 [Actinomycetes bacterium]